MGRRIVQEGHEVGNHTYNHRTLPFLFKASIRNELASTHQLIADLLNVQSKRTYMELLGRHGVAVMDYPASELQDDLGRA
ncbi:MAG: polysaccharide deacetylase family protein [Isosphaeraceae bacterium]